MAASPSSIVGWPIVAPHALGRVVCSLNYADPKAFGGRGPGDGAFNKESEANGRLIAAAPDLLAAAEAQEELVNFVGDDARHAIKRVQQMRRAAILKARGESQ
jgi:hypothetical protein